MVVAKFAPLTLPSLSPLLLVLLLCALLALRLLRLREIARASTTPWPLAVRRPLASPEQVLYQRLVSALPGCTVLHRVALGEVIGVRPGADSRRWSARMRHLHYDFVVCSASATVLAAIVLDDATHSRRANRIRAQASASAGLRLLRWQRKALPDRAAIQAALGEAPRPLFEEPASDTNPSWWPAAPGSGRLPPTH